MFLKPVRSTVSVIDLSFEFAKIKKKVYINATIPQIKFYVQDKTNKLFKIIR